MKKMAVIRQALKLQGDFFAIWDDLEDDESSDEPVRLSPFHWGKLH